VARLEELVADLKKAADSVSPAQRPHRVREWLLALQQETKDDTYKQVHALYEAIQDAGVLALATEIDQKASAMLAADRHLRTLYSDLAEILSRSSLQHNDECCIPEGEYARRLEGFGHEAQTAERSLVFAKTNELIRSEPSSGTTLSNDPGMLVSATPAFWQAVRVGLIPRRIPEVVVLLHGIRTYADWQPLVQKVLQEIPQVSVQPVGYGYFSAPRFLFPLLFRSKPVREIAATLLRLQDKAAQSGQQLRVSVIAHSNGTYVIGRVLREHDTVRLHRLVLCGSVMKRDYPWHSLGGRLATIVINDCGTRDIWPVVAKVVTWGYDDTGRNKFGKVGVVDRLHDCGHSGFMSDANSEIFVRDFWKPWFEQGQVTPSAHGESAKSPWYLGLVANSPWKMITLVAACILVTVALWLYPAIEMVFTWSWTAVRSAFGF
jgi:hypothetical protein